MILRSIIVLTICIHFGSAGSVKRPEMTISECAAKLGECDESKSRPVCGTDDQTYPTRCHLLRVQCSGHQVSLKYRGACKACNEAREYALKHRSRNPSIYIPRCKLDGTYALIQCLSGSGCWCSDITGTRIEKTMVRTGKPKCREFSRRSPTRNSGGNKKRPCAQEDRAIFNSHLIQVFISEYIRSTTAQYQREGRLNQVPLEVLPSPNDVVILNWKFSHLDVNHNQMLDKSEYRELKKLVKRAVKPKRCGRAFGKFCDVDNDERLSRTEWSNCLSKDGVNLLNSHSEVSAKESDIESDCLTDQANALEELKRGNSLFYVPDCTPDGRYHRVQCYNSTPYCWCVNEETGKDIPDTLVKHRRPQCDSSLYTETRQMKGCPDERKIIFLKDLKEFLKTKIIASSHVSANTTKWSSEDERIATLSFVILDKNKNKAWERKEWKTFRELVNSAVPLRKCGRKLPRYCDLNSDKKITLTEWLNCLQAQKVNMSNISSSAQNDAKQQNFPSINNPSSSKPPRLSGSNPLEQYLKD
ncbi:SPARC related modular calcium binding-like protein magu isoform X2 [Haematobia irritans]|uniref:SPARC related modular calcium binding-like protein magu isoform X2 n=1 Tax=Haematobia irritans TaxID=7368 RepID=UPI003F508427